MIELEYYRFAIPTQKSDLIKDDKLQQTDNGSPSLPPERSMQYHLRRILDGKLYLNQIKPSILDCRSKELLYRKCWSEKQVTDEMTLRAAKYKM